VFTLKDSLEEKLSAVSAFPGMSPPPGEPTFAELQADIQRLSTAQEASAYKDVLRMLLRPYFFLLTGYLPETLPSPVGGQYRYCRDSYVNALNSIEAIFACSPRLFPPPSETRTQEPSDAVPDKS